MENNKKLEEIYAALLDGFHQAQQQNPSLDVDTYIMEHLADFNANNLKNNVKESLDFITDVDKNTAKVLEDTKRMRLDSWVRKNVVEQVENPEERAELEKGLQKASEEIVLQTFKENEEGK